tara:strand:- start:33 stop:218 length:186 start_codon:yes stop_codon:yes gene_type:complete
MSKNNQNLCFACQGTGEVKVIKNIAQVGPYHLGKETKEECTFCKVENKIVPNSKKMERTLH